jgi:hypothetical protein
MDPIFFPIDRKIFTKTGSANIPLWGSGIYSLKSLEVESFIEFGIMEVLIQRFYLIF